MRVDFGKECIGCGACVDACPEVFEFDRNVYRPKLNFSADFNRHVTQIQKAVDACPVHNIKLFD